MQVKRGQHPHAHATTGGGTLYDIGIYCINAARYLFRAEPKEVMAMSVNSVPDKLPEIDEIDRRRILRFDGERVATFVSQLRRGGRRVVSSRRHRGPARTSIPPTSTRKGSRIR